MQKYIISVILIAITLGCSSIQLSNGNKYQTLGIATVNHCEKIVDAESKRMGQKCILIETGAFTGWDAIANGIANAVVKILTFGLVNTEKEIKNSDRPNKQRF